MIADPSSEWFEFIGKGAGRAKCTSAKAIDKCEAFEMNFQKMKDQALKLINDLGVKQKLE